MGATPSHLGYTPLHQPCLDSHDRTPQGLHQGWGPSLTLGNEDATSPSIIGLYTRLTALEKDLQISQEENANKEAIIRYLLNNSKLSNAPFDTEIGKLKVQNSNLKKKIARMNEDSGRLKEKLRTARATIFALSVHGVAAVGSQSVPPSCNNRCKSPSSEVLIDLLGSCEEDASAVPSEEDTTLLGDIYDNDLDVEGIETEITPGQSLHESHNPLDSESQDYPYLVHFADSDEEDKMKEGVESVTKKIQVPPGNSDSVAPPQNLGNDVVTFMESADSSPEDSSAPSRPDSTPTSCGSSADETTAPNIAGMKLLDKGLSQLATLTMGSDEDKGPDESAALVRMMAQSLPSLNMYEQAEPLASASTKSRSLPENIDSSVTKPRFKITKTFSSTRERESAASIHWQNGYPTELRYPDLFKYGIHFSPPKSERDLHRTVIVSNLSPEASLGTLLNQVRGGMLIDAKLLDTVKITGKKSALITFLHEHAAMAFQDYAKDNPVVISGVVANIRVVSTPTWPMRIPLHKAIFVFHHTRCLMVYNFPWQHISAHRLHNDITVCKEMTTDQLTYMRKKTDGVLELHFSSVEWAGHAYGMLTSFRAYQGCSVHFAPDPCARRLENLEGQVMACKTVETVAESTTAPDAESTAMDQSGRLPKVEWDNDSETCRGRGFATRP